MADRQINISISGDAAGFERAIQSAVGSAGKLDKSLRNSAVGGAVAGVAMVGVGKAVDFVTDFLGGAADAAKEDTESQDRLALALKNTGRAQALSTEQIEAAISANQRKGVGDAEQRAGISDFLDITKSATEAMKLNQATVELAAAKGLAYADAEAIIRSAAAGKTAALQKAGVEVQKHADITTIGTAVMNKFGGSLDAVATTEGGKMKASNEKMHEAMEKVGKIINQIAVVALPVLANVMTWIVDNVMPPLEQAFKVLGPIVSTTFAIIGRAIGATVTIIRGVVGIVSGVVNSVVGIWKGAINGVISAIDWVIGAMNGIQVHIHAGPINIDWNGLNLPMIPRLHSGGVVPGSGDVLAMLQGGETVIPRGGGGSVTIYVYGDTYGDGIDQLADKLALRLRLAGA